MKDEAEIAKARVQFVLQKKAENRDSFHPVSLRAHWAGAHCGFGDHMVDGEWKLFLCGWLAKHKEAQT